MQKSEEIALADIEIGDRVRGINSDQVRGLAMNISQHGQQTPVLLRHTNGGAKKYALVYGAHRCAARLELGHDTVLATVKKMTAAEARLVEIDENLFRHDLTVLDKAISLAERKRAYEEQYPETKAGGDRKSNMFSDQIGKSADLKFTAVTADKLGISESQIEKSVAVTKTLTDDAIEALRGRPEANNFTVLARIAKLPAKSQKKLVGSVAKEADAKVVDLIDKLEGKKPADKPDPAEKIIKAFMALTAAEKKRAIKALQDAGEL